MTQSGCLNATRFDQPIRSTDPRLCVLESTIDTTGGDSPAANTALFNGVAAGDQSLAFQAG